MGQLLFYDEKEMHVFDCYITSVEQEAPIPLDVTPLDAMAVQTIYRPNTTAKAVFDIREVKAELDPTMMKRIAKYNLDKEFWELNDRKNKVEEELRRLDSKVAEMREKIGLMDSLVLKIWEDEDFDEDKYTPNDDDDYEEYD